MQRNELIEDRKRHFAAAVAADRKGEYRSAAAREAQSTGYGGPDYWQYLDNHAGEMERKGIADAYTRTLAQALSGNNGD